MSVPYTVLVALVIVSSVWVGVPVVEKNWEHVQERNHTDAYELKQDFLTGNLSEYEVWYSLKKGTVLVLARTDSGLFLGVIVRIFEWRNGSLHVLDSNTGYVCTAMVHPYGYWRYIQKRDSYAPMILGSPMYHLLFRWFE
jgi:hypothetical protein